jgi:hypothetical protein
MSASTGELGYSATYEPNRQNELELNVVRVPKCETGPV